MGKPILLCNYDLFSAVIFPSHTLYGQRSHQNTYISDFHNYTIMDQITILEALFLGLVQGFTEWLPISSSGHLVIFESLLGISVPADFNIVIMMGTIAALILYFPEKNSPVIDGHCGV